MDIEELGQGLERMRRLIGERETAMFAAALSLEIVRCARSLEMLRAASEVARPRLWIEESTNGEALRGTFETRTESIPLSQGQAQAALYLTEREGWVQLSYSKHAAAFFGNRNRKRGTHTLGVSRLLEKWLESKRGPGGGIRFKRRVHVERREAASP